MIDFGDLIEDTLTGKTGYVFGKLTYKTGCCYYKVDDESDSEEYIDAMRAKLIKKDALDFEEVKVTRYKLKGIK